MTLADLYRSPHLARRARGVVPSAAWLTLDRDQRLMALRNGLVPAMSGAEGEGEGGAQGEGSGEGAEGAGGSGEGEGAPGEGEGEGDGEGDGDGEETAEQLRAQVADAEKRAKAATDEANRIKREAAERAKKERQTSRQQAAQEGRWEEVAHEHERERDEAVAERDQARTELAQFKRQVTVRDVATRLAFRDPSDAIHFIQDEDAEDEKLAEAALRTVAKKKPYLVDTQRRSGLAGGGANGTGKPDPARDHRDLISGLLGTPSGN